MYQAILGSMRMRHQIEKKILIEAGMATYLVLAPSPAHFCAKGALTLSIGRSALSFSMRDLPMQKLDMDALWRQLVQVQTPLYRELGMSTHRNEQILALDLRVRFPARISSQIPRSPAFGPGIRENKSESVHLLRAMYAALTRRNSLRGGSIQLAP
jgi:hypothetical protein